MHAAIRAAKTVIVQFNRAVPRTLGESFIHVDEIDLAIECYVPPYEHHMPEIGEVERRIGGYVADLVPDGATIQMGIGAIPAAVGAALHRQEGPGRPHGDVHRHRRRPRRGRRRSTAVARSGTAARSSRRSCSGTRRLYDFANDNPMVEMRPVDFTNDTHVIRSFSRMTAINSAIEIDLTGQIVADSIGHRMYSGVGGQMDFIRGASLAPEGRAIIALPATAASGARSRIVASLQDGAGVVTTRAHARTVVTEHGIAELWGRSLRERAKALIAIAAPEFRNELTSEARRLHLE